MIKTTPTFHGDVVQFYSGQEYCGRLTINYSQKEASIWNVEIFEEFRGRKLGQQMMKETMEFLTETSPEIPLVYLTVNVDNEPAKRVYEKTGFRIVGRDSTFRTDEIYRMEYYMKPAKDCYWTVNGNRKVILDGKEFDDFVPMEFAIKGVRTSKATAYLLSVGFSREEAEEYLSGLNPKEI